MKCPSCGNEIPNDSKFCPFCGARINLERVNQESQKVEQSAENSDRKSENDKITITIPKIKFNKLSKLQPWVILILIACLIFTGIKTSKYYQIIKFLQSESISEISDSYYPHENIIYLSASGTDNAVDYSVVCTHPVVKILYTWPPKLLDLQYEKQLGQDYYINIKPLKKGIGVINFSNSVDDSETFNVLVVVGD